jgi:hypothetical protein
MANWKDFAENEYWPAMRMALIWQGVLGVLSALLLDFGQTFRVFGVAFLCHWAIIWIVLFRRPLTPTRFDLWIVRYATLPLMILIGGFAPAWLRLIGTPPGEIP